MMKSVDILKEDLVLIIKKASEILLKVDLDESTVDLVPIRKAEQILESLNMIDDITNMEIPF